MGEYTGKNLRDKFRHEFFDKTNTELFQIFSKATSIYVQTGSKSILTAALAAGWTLTAERKLSQDRLEKTGSIFVHLAKEE